MVIRLTWGKLRAGAWSDFERTYRANVITKGKTVKGLRGRWLAQDSGDKDTGFAVSLWDNLPDMQAYEQSALYKEIMAPLQPFFVGEYKTYRCEVKYTDSRSPRSPWIWIACPSNRARESSRSTRDLRSDPRAGETGA